MSNEQGKQPTIFLIEEDDDTRKPLVETLRKEGYRVIVTLDEADALELASGWRVKADLVLVNLVGKPAEKLLEVGRGVREQAKYDGHTPLVVMPEITART